jgi:hypothetical protein
VAWSVLAVDDWVDSVVQDDADVDFIGGNGTLEAMRLGGCVGGYVGGYGA